MSRGAARDTLASGSDRLLLQRSRLRRSYNRDERVATQRSWCRAGLLATFGVPPEGIGIIIGIDRVLDMMRTTVNVGSDVVTAAVVDRQMRQSSSVPPP